MKQIKLLIIFIATISLLVSCTEKINIKVHIKESSPFLLTINKDFLHKKQLQVNSEKYKKIIEWFHNNVYGWRSAPSVSYSPTILIEQSDFRLLILNDGVIIGFNDDVGIPRLYSKSVNIRTFDFLKQ